MDALWITQVSGVPVAENFQTTQGLGSPIIINTVTNGLYALIAGVVTPVGGGGGGGGTVTTTGTPAAGNLTQFSGATSITNGDLSGDVTTVGTLVTTIAANAVSLAKMADVATATVFYRKTAGTGDPEVQPLATLKTDLGLAGTNTGDQTITLTSDVTGSGTGSFATTIAANAVTDAKLRQSAGLSVIGRSANTTGDVADITGAANGVLRVSGTTLAFGAVDLATAMVTGDLPFANIAQIATARILGRVTAATGDIEVLTGTQATTLLDTFTSTLKGLAPSSGGGTTNFLRADGTWAAPGGGSPGGSSGNIQYNNAGAFGGATRLNVNASGNLRADYASTNTTPGADQIEFAPQRIGATNGLIFPSFETQGGIDYPVARMLSRISVAWIMAQGSAGAVSNFGIAALAALGTLAPPPAQASTPRAARAFRAQYTSATTAGSTAGLQNNSTANHQNWTVGTGTASDGGGFYANFRFIPADPAAVTGAHMFVGMRSATSAPSAAVNPNTLTNAIGVAQLNGGANLNIVYGGSAAQTSIDLGANFPAAGAALHEYMLELWAPPNSNTHVYYRVTRLNTGNTAEGDLTGTAGTALPSSGTFLGPILYRSNNATALAVRIHVISVYIEADL